MSYDPKARIGKVYSMYNPAAIQVIYQNGIDPESNRPLPSRTRQEFTDECDINQIMKRYEANGIWPEQMRAEPMYVDFVGMPDLAGALLAIDEAEEAFMRLPAIVRKEFDNDAVRFVEYAQDGANLEQLRKWGLAEPEKAPPEPVRVEVVEKPKKPADPPAPPQGA